ncbi:MAG: Gfo/Idh/MocA family oxidoreductase [Fuerstiella sp.]|jgi:predicted dehydrogenase|nr:Gfo/Idh/MocA family oxidoreductase [Fuerstiella sp.]MDG2127492.1 Gfo/Idh/MocA family oxidoreductase [Fuerstiella sp.]
MLSHPTNTRRDFLKTSSAGAAALGVPLFWNRRAHAGQDANDRKTVASVGVGGSRGRYSRGGSIAMQAARLGQTVAVCDVDTRHNNEFNGKFDSQLQMFTDYREMLDKVKPNIVTIGTPDHWHVPIAIAALRSGADVYCEKPLTLTIDEGIQIGKVVAETGKVFQVGTQQRSENDRKFLQAVAMVHEGVIGDNVTAHVAIGGVAKGGPFEATMAPKDLDWDMWLGPAPEALYMEERRKMFRWFAEYSGGKMTDWGAHHIDIATWALGKQDTGPVKVSGTGQFPPCVPDNFDFVKWFAGEAHLPNAFNSAMNFNLKLEYADGLVMTVHDKYVSEDGKTEFPNGILFEGSKGRFFVNRGKLTGKPVEELTDADMKRIDDRIVELYGGEPTGHMQNFFDCVESRKNPVSDVFTHHRTMTSCHMCNITLMLGRELNWDPKTQEFIGDDQANALKTRPQRPGYTS